MDNKVFNVNGESRLQFNLTLKLLLTDQYDYDVEKFDTTTSFGRIGTRVSGYKFTYKKGLILYWLMDDKLKQKGVKPIEELVDNCPISKTHHKLLRKFKLALLDKDISKRVGIPFELLEHALWNWLRNFNEYDKLSLGNWDYNCDHDGSNHKGFRIYNESWGRVDNDGYSIAAIMPIYTWYGK